jgi:hypothetical protein
MLMAGVAVLLVARMAGTSVAMTEQVYGHFRNQSYQDAQARLDRERAARGYDLGYFERTNDLPATSRSPGPIALSLHPDHLGAKSPETDQGRHSND